MSWGERSCSREKAPKNEYGGCTYATITNCNVDCPHYTSNGLPPDSKPQLTTKEMADVIRKKHPEFVKMIQDGTVKISIVRDGKTEEITKQDDRRDTLHDGLNKRF